MDTGKDDVDVVDVTEEVELGSLEFSNNAGDQVLRFCQQTEEKVAEERIRQK